MPRIVKMLPASRADYSFGDLVYWHLFVYGTRPTGDPSAVAGRIWDSSRFAEKARITERTLRNWISDRHLPDDTIQLNEALFGDNAAFDSWRLELQQALHRARAGKKRKSAEDPNEPAQDAAMDHAADDNAEDVSFRPSASRQLVVRTGLPDRVRRMPHGSSSKAPRQRAIIACGAGLVAMAGWYAWTRSASEPRRDAAHVATSSTSASPSPNVPPATAPTPGFLPPAPQPVHNPVSPNVVPKRAGPSPQEIAAAKRVAEDERLAREATARKQAQEDDARRAREDAARREAKAADDARAQRAAEERRIEDEAIAARKAAYDKQQREKIEEAARRDRDEQAGIAAPNDHAANMREIAGLGFKATEGVSLHGQDLGYVLAASEVDCAHACRQDGCDGFSYFRAQPISPSDSGRICARYKGPLTRSTNPSYISGERDDTIPVPSPRAAASDPPMTVAAQDGAASAEPALPDGVMQCANGPVKVTGFRLTCDAILGGGTTLGSAQLSYSVRSVNECAGKCRPLPACVGFTFNANGSSDRHACQIFGPSPEKRASTGWISGERP